MTYRSSTQPLCRHCGKKIPKITGCIYFGHQTANNLGLVCTRTERPKTREEAQKLTNLKIVSIKYGRQFNAETGKEDGRYVYGATTWDGESYRDQFFCTNNCAERFGYLFAQKGYITKAFQDAFAKQNAGRGVQLISRGEPL